MMNYSSSPSKDGYGKSLASNYYYFDKLSMPQQGKLGPVRGGRGSRIYTD